MNSRTLLNVVKGTEYFVSIINECCLTKEYNFRVNMEELIAAKNSTLYEYSKRRNIRINLTLRPVRATIITVEKQ